MRILIAAGIYPPDPGGPATSARSLFDEFKRRGILCTVVPFRDVRHLLPIVRHFAYLFHLVRVANRGDIILAFDPVSTGLPAFIAARMCGARFFVKIGGDYAWEQYMQSKKQKGKSQNGKPKFVNAEEFQKRKLFGKYALFRIIERFVAKYAEKVFAPSNYLKKIVMLWGVSEHNITIVPNAAEGDFLSVPEKTSTRALLDLSGRVIVTAGRFVPWKGFDALISILPDIIHAFPDANLVIIGDGPDKMRLECLARANGISGKVRFTGGLPRETLFQYVRASDAFVLYTGYEGLSHQLLEAMVLGSAIIASDAGGNTDLIEHGKEGMIVRYGNETELLAALTAVLSDSVPVDDMARAAQEKAENYTIARSADAALSAFA